jgi:hypothetical protein
MNLNSFKFWIWIKTNRHRLLLCEGPTCQCPTPPLSPDRVVASCRPSLASSTPASCRRPQLRGAAIAGAPPLLFPLCHRSGYKARQSPPGRKFPRAPFPLASKRAPLRPRPLAFGPHRCRNSLQPHRNQPICRCRHRFMVSTARALLHTKWSHSSIPPPPQVLQDSFYVDAGHPDSLAAAATVTHHRRSHLAIATLDRWAPPPTTLPAATPLVPRLSHHWPRRTEAISEPPPVVPPCAPWAQWSRWGVPCVSAWHVPARLPLAAGSGGYGPKL